MVWEGLVLPLGSMMEKRWAQQGDLRRDPEYIPVLPLSSKVLLRKELCSQYDGFQMGSHTKDTLEGPSLSLDTRFLP